MLWFTRVDAPAFAGTLVRVRSKGLVRKETTMKAIVAPIAACVALCAPAFASAIEVEFDRELLATAEGRELVLEMIEDAAYNFCTTEATNQRALIATSTCIREMTDQLVERTGNEILAQMVVSFDDIR